MMQVMQEEAGDNAGFQFFADPEQLDLLRDDKGKLPPDALRTLRAQRRVGPGRPKNSRNKRNEKVAKWFIAKYGDPLEALGEIINTPEDLLYEQMILAQGGEAKGKRVTGRDAFEFRRQAILDALPYIHGKQPIAVDISGKADAVIIIPGLNAPLGFSHEQLAEATEKLGAEAIERAGIRMVDGRLLTSPGDSDADENEGEDADEDGGDDDGDSGDAG